MTKKSKKLSVYDLICNMNGLKKTMTVCAFILCFMGAAVGLTMQYLKVVYIRDRGEIASYYTFKSDAEHILAEKGIATMAFDVVDFTGFEGKMGVINISRAFPVTLVVDGEATEIMTPEITVRQLLQQQGVELTPDDHVNLPLHFYISEGDEVVVERIKERQMVEEEEIVPEIIYKQSPLLKVGRTRTLTQGRSGTLTKTYQVTYLDGELTQKTLVSEEVTKAPVNTVVLCGANVPVSKIDWGISMDANGKPTQYQALLTHQVATGYSASSGSWGASGMTLFDGCVAVRSKQIPYGTKMYITSSDGSFVYGYAIAADTGEGLMADAIDIDLFYETYAESCLNGRKYLDVYVLEWGNGKDAWTK